ncbi:MAG: rod shape-determining protein MreC [Candidatus Yanofskybacteria bacterium]|nr:rod shape-determining protein MreC [Candidatus Yanofskybacteria bacterium]
MALKFILPAFLLVLAFIGIAYWAGAQNFILAQVADPGASLFERFSLDRILLRQVRDFKQLAHRNEELEREHQDLLSRLAQMEELEDENQFLHKALQIKVPGFIIRYASIFNLSNTPDSFQVLVNEGTNIGIAVDDIVITNERVLIGVVKEVQPSFARVQIMNTPGFEILGRTLGGDTTGIVKGNSDGSLKFDLIVQGEEIKEGDTIVSSGRDRFPSALLLGKVEHIEIDQSTLFQDVRIKPAFEYLTGRVIILHRQ